MNIAFKLLNEVVTEKKLGFLKNSDLLRPVIRFHDLHESLSVPQGYKDRQ